LTAAATSIASAVEEQSATTRDIAASIHTAAGHTTSAAGEIFSVEQMARRSVTAFGEIGDLTARVAARAKDQLTGAGFKVTDVGNLSVSDVSATTVYYTDADDEHATADAVGQKLGAPVQPRIPALTNQPPGVIVLVTG